VSHHTRLVEAVRERGHRMTPQREMILQALHRGHMTAEEICRAVHATSPAVNLATVYRTLDLLRELHWLCAIDTGEGCVRYELTDEQPHHHLVCQVRGASVKLDCAALEPLENDLCKRYGFQVNLEHLALFGLCPVCQRRKSDKNKSDRAGAKQP